MDSHRGRRRLWRGALPMAMVVLLPAGGLAGFVPSSGTRSPDPPADPPEEEAAPFAPLAPLIGEWTGEGAGPGGEYGVVVEFRFLMAASYLEIRRQAIFMPQEGTPEGKSEEEIVILGFDALRETYVGFVFRAGGVIEPLSVDLQGEGRVIVLTGQGPGINRPPGGWIDRQTYTLTGEREITELREQASPGRGFEVLARGRMTRPARPGS